MAEALVVSVITMLGQIAITEAVAKAKRHQSGVGDGIKFIQDELSTMKAFLRDAERRSLRGEVVSEWVAQVRDEAYKVEDILDEFLVQMNVLKSRRPMGCLDLKFYCSYVPSFFKQKVVCLQFCSQIEIIKKEVEVISKRREHYSLQEGTSASLEDETSGHHGVPPFFEEADIVGIDEDIKQLKQWLLTEEEDHQRSIISVVGMGGSGKTTLVKKVYNCVKGQFDCHAWVSVSQAFQTKEILKCMFKEFCGSEAPSNVAMSIPRLQEAIFNYLQNRRYVLVLDDIWGVNAWEGVKYALPLESEGKIIFTTRIANVASPIDETSHVHHLKPLSPELAWGLFCRKAFKNSNPSECCLQGLRQIGEAMVKRCAGLPLPLVAIGGLMSKKDANQLVWNEVCESLDWEMLHNQDLEKVSRVLLPSYNYLPPALKYCFLYCCMFPEDYRIKITRLIRLWVAEGFIKDHPRKTLEEVANDNLIQLIDRGMLQVDYDKFDFCVTACRVHDLMHDMGVHMSKKEQFGVVFTKQSNNVVIGGQRRVTIYNHSIGIPLNVVDLKARSFLTFSMNEFPLSTLHQLLMNLKSLRVLDLSGTNIKHLPGEVGELIHLRYLSLKWTQVHELPTSLRKLQNLQTLDVRNTKVVSLPHGIQIAMFPQLRHLLLRSTKRDSGRRIPIHLGMSIIRNGNNSLSNLQTLAGVCANESLASQLCYLTQLKKLTIYGVKEEYCVELCAAINNMQHLRFLIIWGISGEEVLDLETMTLPSTYLEILELGGIIDGLPQWIGSQNCLQQVVLSSSKLREDPLSTFAQLPNLEYLILTDAYVGRRMDWGNAGNEGRLVFPKLKILQINHFLELEEMNEIEEGTSMPCLRYLIIDNCPKLKKLPHGFQHLKALHELLIGNMPKDFIWRLRFHCEGEVVEDGNEGGEDHWMIQHIPQVWIVQMTDGRYVYEENIYSNQVKDNFTVTK